MPVGVRVFARAACAGAAEVEVLLQQLTSLRPRDRDGNVGEAELLALGDIAQRGELERVTHLLPHEVRVARVVQPGSSLKERLRIAETRTLSSKKGKSDTSISRVVSRSELSKEAPR